MCYSKGIQTLHISVIFHDIIQKMKGTSRVLMKENGEILSKKLWDGHLWNPSYFVAIVSENTEEQSRKYIKNQKRK